MPDLDILIEISDFYQIDIRELLDGERKSEKMEKELKDTVLKVADYSNEEKIRITKRMNIMFILGFISSILYFILLFTDRADNFIGGVCLGITLGMMIVGIIITSKYYSKIRSTKNRVLRKMINL